MISRIPRLVIFDSLTRSGTGKVTVMLNEVMKSKVFEERGFAYM
jgi:hypothetical protein